MSTGPHPVRSGPLRASLTALGCKVNFAEMADLAGILAAAGVEVVRDDEPADVRVLNSCTVTLQADATTRRRLARLRRDDPDAHIVLTGCSVDGNPDRYPTADTGGAPRPVPGVDAIFDNAHKDDVAGHVLGLAGFPCAIAAPTDPAAALRARAFLKVQDGCDHRCTYCSVWRARGRSESTTLQRCVERFDALVEGGVREVVLCGVDLGSWRGEHDLRLHHLVGTLLERCGPARLRLSSINANDIDGSLLELAAHPRLCSHWHIPLQSGADPVLRAMHRGYRRARYLRVVEGLRAADPDVEVTTDVMVAFPGETGDDHRATLDLVERVGFLHCHVFRYSARPGTPAAALGGAVDDATAKQRSREVRRAAARTAAERRARMVGRAVEVVWDRVDGAVARGLSGGWHTVTVAAAPGARAGDLAWVTVDAVDGEGLRATLLHP